MPGRHVGATRDDRGAAVVDFVLVSSLVVALFAVVFQVGLALHTRNVLVAAAAEGARYGANADRDPEDARQHTIEAIGDALSPGYARKAEVSAPTLADGVLEVRVSAPMPLFFLLAGPVRLDVAGHALEEEAG